MSRQHKAAVSTAPGDAVVGDAAIALLNRAVAAHEAGRLDEAKGLLQTVIQQSPENGQALQRLGVICLQQGDNQAALSYLDGAVRGNAVEPAVHVNHACALRRVGRLQEALDACMRAIRLSPDFADAYANMVQTLDQMQRYGDALTVQRQLLALRPVSAEVRLQLARLLILTDQTEAAVETLYDLLGMQPLSSQAYTNLGVALRRLGRLAEAEAAYRTALGFNPTDAGLLGNLGVLLQDVDRYPEAIECFRHALAHHPDSAPTHLNLSVALRDEMRNVESVAHARAAIRLDPSMAAAHTSLAFGLLMQGDYAEGLAEYEWRSRMADFPSPRRHFTSPAWAGADMAGKTLLVHDEQGVGDALMCARFAQMLRAQGVRVILECNSQLVRLFSSMPGIDAVVCRGQPLPPHDAHVSLLSLPHLMKLRIDTIPSATPYLATEPALCAQWAARLGAVPGLRVGLVWAGNPEFKADRLRSPGLAAFLPMLEVPGVSFFGLQKGPGRKDLDIVGALPACFTDLGPEITDFADTAAIMANLDLIITSCTGPAHLAGALGRPTWTILPFAPDWRWGERAEDTFWYPTMCLFRQDRRGDWSGVVNRVVDALSARAVRPNP